MPRVITPFCNNLRLGDPVLYTKNGRYGKVAATPRESSRRTKILLKDGARPYYLPVEHLRLLVDGTPEDVPPCNGLPTFLIEKTPEEFTQPGRFEAQAQPIKEPPDLYSHAVPDGEHIKSYVVTWIDRAGKFHVEKIAAKGIVMAITLFYGQLKETAIVSVVCVL